MKYTLFEAIAIIVGTPRRIRRYKNGWSTYNNDNRTLHTPITGNDGWWPSIEAQKAKIWEVEPEEIFVWGACDDDKRSGLHISRPTYSCEDREWQSEGKMYLMEKYLFLDDNFQKYKLVLIDN